MDPATGRWVVCPACTAYREAVNHAWARDRARYWDWFSCRCGAYDKTLTKVHHHARSCASQGGGTPKRPPPCAVCLGEDPDCWLCEGEGS
jgi:hypothetical protein